MLKKKLYTLIVFLLVLKSVKAELINGDIDSGSSFSFSIGSQCLYVPQGRLFVGSKLPVSNNNFAVSAAIRNHSKFTGLTPPKVTLNNVLQQDNPLHGAAIKFLTLIGRQPLIVKKSDCSTLYIIDDHISSPVIEVLSAYNISDANGKVTKDILAITSTDPNSFTLPDDAFKQNIAFAAVANQDGKFDGNGSGIAVIPLEVVTEKLKNSQNEEFSKRVFKFAAINAQNGQKNENKAAPLGKDSDCIKIENPVNKISKKVDMFFEQRLKRDDKHLGLLYIALHVKSGSSSNDGARAIVLAELINNELIFSAIAPDATFISDDKILGVRGADKKISIEKVRTMVTTTHLHYLIVVKNTSESKDKKKVFAIPLVNNPGNSHHGKLAKADSIPVNVFTANNPHAFLTRAYVHPAVHENDLLNENSIQACIGADGVLPSDITDIKIVNNTVFVSTAQSGNNLQPGIFFSQALFDQFGRINGWTNWQRASAGGFKVFGFDLDPLLNIFWYIPQNSDLTTQNVFRTSWGEINNALSVIAAREFSQACGGVYGCFNFPSITNSFSQNLGNKISFLVLTGLNKIALIQTGNDRLGFFGPTIIKTEDNSFRSINGSLDGFRESASQIFISGGVLEKLSNINSADVVSDGISGWLAVGGTSGLAILSRTDGRGWDAINGLGNNFTGLTEEMSFKIIGSYKNIRKIVSNKNSLYVLTSEKLDKIEITISAIFSNSFNITTLAKTCENEFNNTLSFSDMLVSGNLALLATSSGLFRSAEDVDISLVQVNNGVRWLQMPLPESAGSLNNCGPVTRFFSISKNGFETDVVNDGNIFVLNAYTGFETTQIYRLSLNNGKIYLFPDYFIGLENGDTIKGKNSYFVNLNEYRNYVVTDGAIIGVTQSALANEPAKFIILPPQLKSGQRFGANKDTIKINLNIPSANSIGLSIRDSASGNWIVPGNFGLRVNQ